MLHCPALLGLAKFFWHKSVSSTLILEISIDHQIFFFLKSEECSHMVCPLEEWSHCLLIMPVETTIEAWWVV